MARSVKPIRFLRRSVGFAVKGVKRGVGGAVRLAWPRNGRKRSNGVVSSGSDPESRMTRRRRRCGELLQNVVFNDAMHGTGCH